MDQVRAAGIAVTLTVRGEVRPLPQGLDLAAYRIVQEALTNCLRHSGATRASVTVTHGADVRLEVVDDGTGAVRSLRRRARPGRHARARGGVRRPAERGAGRGWRVPGGRLPADGATGATGVTG